MLRFERNKKILTRRVEENAYEDCSRGKPFAAQMSVGNASFKFGGYCMNKNTKTDPARKDDPEMEHPKGTLVLTLVYMVTIIVLWSWVYQILLSRGVTQ